MNQRLPQIVRYLDSVDTGPDSGASCPHCGATGRYIHTFEARDTDGKIVRRAAMSGCVKLFPVHPFAREEMRIREKEKRNERAHGRASLASWDVAILDVIEAFRSGRMDEGTAAALVRAEQARATSYRRARFRGRR